MRPRHLVTMRRLRLGIAQYVLLMSTYEQKWTETIYWRWNMSKKDEEFNVSFGMRTLWNIRGKGKWLVMDYENHTKHHFRHKAEANKFAREKGLSDPISIEDYL